MNKHRFEEHNSISCNGGKPTWEDMITVNISKGFALDLIQTIARQVGDLKTGEVEFNIMGTFKKGKKS